MAYSTVQVDEGRYRLADGENLVELQSRITVAAASGAAFVEFPTAAGTLVSVLVTPATMVHFETVDEPALDESWSHLPEMPRLNLDFDL